MTQFLISESQKLRRFTTKTFTQLCVTKAVTLLLTLAGISPISGALANTRQDGQGYLIRLINLEINQTEWFKSAAIKCHAFKTPVDNRYTLSKVPDPLYAE